MKKLIKHYSKKTQMEEIGKKYGVDFGINSKKSLDSFLKKKKYKALRLLLINNS